MTRQELYAKIDAVTLELTQIERVMGRRGMESELTHEEKDEAYGYLNEAFSMLDDIQKEIL